MIKLNNKDEAKILKENTRFAKEENGEFKVPVSDFQIRGNKARE